MTIKKNIVILTSAVLMFAAVFGFAKPTFAADYYVACPFYPATNRTIVNINADLIWEYKDKPQEAYRSVNLPAGDYKVSLFSYDNYDERDEVDQPNESYFVELKNGSSLIASSHKTPDLADNVKSATWNGVVNSSLHLSSAVTTLVARHANYVQEMTSPNSLTAGCAAFDLIVPPDPVLNISCSVNPSVANVGDSMLWTSTASGGNNSYTYTWTGTDSLYSNSSSVSKSYSNAGTKTATVTVTSGAQSVSQSCTATVNQVVDPTLTGSCYVSPSSVNTNGYLDWSATASGGNLSYTYTWTGTDSLYSNSSSVSKLYSSAGTKTGTVTITSNGQSIVRSCSAVVLDDEDEDLNVTCDADDSSVETNEDVTFEAFVTGGDGNYDYDWDGDDGLHGSSREVTWDYNDDGTKDATVTVTDGNGQSDSASCSTRVNDDNNNDDLNVSCYANPTNPQIGQRMNWYASVSGGDGDYEYDWNGNDGLNTSSHSPAMTYNTSGQKWAELEVTDGDGNSDTTTCYANVSQNQVLAFSQYNQTPIAPAVYLNQVPYTGATENWAVGIFIAILALLSAYVAYVVISYKKANGTM